MSSPAAAVAGTAWVLETIGANVWAWRESGKKTRPAKKDVARRVRERLIVVLMTRSLPLLQRLAKHLATHTRGQVAENVALVSYRISGFSRLYVPQPLAQTDLTLRRGNLVLLVEVKYRSSRARGHVAFSPTQKQRLLRQALLVAGRMPGATVRLEVCLVFPHWPFLQRIPLTEH